MEKRGISPLIATVLLLGFTIALAAVIINWGQTFTKDIQTQTEQTSTIKITCANEVSFDISTACFTGSNLKVIVKNEGTKDIDKFAYRVYSSPTASVITGSLDDPSLQTDLKAFEIKEYLLNGTNSSVRQVELIPVVTIKGKQTTCTSNNDKFGDIDGQPLLAC